MCGICGFVNNDHDLPVDKDILVSMTDIMSHRGPDGDGFYSGHGAGLGFRRLSIIDLETGDQPIKNEDGTVVVICNGEIYNFKELREELISKGHRFSTRSDAEVIVHLYEDHGTECLKYLRGMFGLAIWDVSNRRLILARDRMGIKPLYYAVSQDALFFASEIKSILAGGCIERGMETGALSNLFSLGFITSPGTLFKGVRSVLPGEYLVFENGDLSIHNYWELVFTSQGSDKWSPDKWAQELFEKLKETVKLHMRSDVEVGAWLSSGIDSSSIVSLMRHFTDRQIQTFTMEFEGSGIDGDLSRKVLSDFDGYDVVNHKVMFKTGDFSLFPEALWHCESPFTAGVEVNRMVLSKFTSSKVKVILTGEGADEIFGGYPWYRSDRILRPLSGLPFFLRRLISSMPFIHRRWPAGSKALLCSGEMDINRYSCLIGPGQVSAPVESILSHDAAGKLKAEDHLFSKHIKQETLEGHHPITRLLMHDMKLRLPDCIIHHLDRTSMAHSLEARVPFLDHELVELCAKMPHSLKMKGLSEKYILRKAVKDILPREIVQRKKYAQRAPHQKWFRMKLPEFADELLSETSLRNKGYFDPCYITRIRERHISGKYNYGKLLLGVLGVQLWDDIFVRGRGV